MSHEDAGKWSKEFPEKVGAYWFYGYRYGRVSCGSPCEPVLLLVNCGKTQTGYLYTAEGGFMFKKEVEDPHFLPVQLPELPEID